MKHGVVRYVVLGFYIVSLLGGMAFRATSGLAQDRSISGASTVIFQEDKVRGFELQEPPAVSQGAFCKFTTLGNGIVNLGHVYKPKVWAIYHNKQNARVGTIVYQKLATGKLDLVWISEGTTYEVTETKQEITPPVSPNMPAGPSYVLAYWIDWYDPNTNNQVTEGRAVIGYTHYWRFIGSPYQKFAESNVCNSIIPQMKPYATLINTEGTVNSNLNFYVYRYPMNVTVYVKWDGAVIGSVKTGSVGDAAGLVKVPASIMGPHTLTFSYGSWISSATYTVKPRIKIIPSSVSRGQTVNVSLRGYKGFEPVKIRWKKGDTYVQIATVTTSSTGSANIDVKVPTFVPDGTTSVRGDGVYAHAQTNAVTVSGGPFVASQVKIPTPTSTQTTTATATSTSTPTPTAPTATPTVQAPTETPTAEATAPVEETQTVIPDASPVVTT
jgi:hypothetical protein